MSGLGETVAALRRLRTSGLVAPSSGGVVETAAFGANPGALRMLSYVPNELQPGAPLVVVLHGCTQTAEAHVRAAGWLMLADRCGFAVLAPEQRPANNLNRCFNWFRPEHATRDRGEAASIVAMVRFLVGAHRLDTRRVFVTGLSAGGAMTSVLLATYPEVFAGGGIVAGLPFGVADNVQSAWGAMRGGAGRSADLVRSVHDASSSKATLPRVTIWHGDADATVNATNATDIAQQWVGAHGLAIDQGETEIVGGRTRVIWRSSRTGAAMVESNIIHGLGHGVPLSTLGEDGVGAVAPYMLEAGVSSATEIARFWGLVGKTMPRSNPPTPDRTSSEPSDQSRLGDRVMASLSGHVSADVESVIANALKSAGLMTSPREDG